MKKALTLILALVMCLSLIPMTALAYGNEYIQLEKSNFDPNEIITFDYSGYRSQIKEGDFVYLTIFQKTASGDYEEGERRWLSVDEITNWLNAPAENGDYQLRLTRNDVLISTIPFTVGKAAKDGVISIDKTAYTALDPITVTVSGITQQMVTSKAYISIYEKGAAHDNKLGDIKYVTAGSSTQTLFAPNKNGEFEVRLYNTDGLYNADTFVMSVPFTVSGASNTSGWAQDQNVAEKAAQYGLVPDSLKGADWTKPITRREFAAVSVKLYENLTGTTATPAATNPFTDTNDVEVLKALNIGITNGTSADKFSPDVLLNREQAATMLLRTLKAAYIQGWTLATDGNYTLNFTMPTKFADDDKISDWAKPSVYFMAANGIINGTGNNLFSPRATTAAEEAALYASATREQSLAIAVRIVDNLKDKPLDFQQGAAGNQPTAPEQPTTPPSGSIDSALLGEWKGQGTVTNAYGNTSITYLSYTFNENGTFVYYFKSYYAEYEYRGKYSASNGKANFYDIELVLIGVQNQGDPPIPVDKVMGYEFGTDNDGAYLGIPSLRHRAEDTNVEINDSTRFKFRKQ